MTTTADVTSTVEASDDLGADPPINAQLTVDGIAALAAVKIEQSDRHRRERANAIHHLLTWLSTFPGADWQQRWQATGGGRAGPGLDSGGNSTATAASSMRALRTRSSRSR